MTSHGIKMLGYLCEIKKWKRLLSFSYTEPVFAKLQLSPQKYDLTVQTGTAFQFSVPFIHVY